ncbi:MAG: hypothetical protein AW08_03435 [Candidatus Accumulibacter adjunctus]|uniref:Uncharacterized protein n=1 Tax=Candidatus Accumulibacter adjunctus TaxID=1454001 RepID=A0A011M6D0_9PROT|nr:MAG: hypothetical protein AW08_03435 [Candidatus Accumulibacter adjunctus]
MLCRPLSRVQLSAQRAAAIEGQHRRTLQVAGTVLQGRGADEDTIKPVEVASEVEPVYPGFIVSKRRV